jgi:catechol 2,3-dioxygenase
VSEAFYFYDPEGNGIELYYDRDPKTWKWENGTIQMATLYIDPLEYIQRYIVLEEKDTKTAMGHIHLKVGDITVAKQFYVDVLGFEVTAELPSALFVSVDQYHHHIGMNTWESFGAEKRNESLGLASFEFILSEKQDVEKLKDRLQKHAIPFDQEGDTCTFRDPWNTQIRIGLAT